MPTFALQQQSRVSAKRHRPAKLKILTLCPSAENWLIPELGQSLCIVGLLNLTPYLKPPKGIYCLHLKMGDFTV